LSSPYQVSPTKIPTAAPSTAPKFYPDWANDLTCKNDNNKPQYMVLNPTIWLLGSRESCCKSLTSSIFVQLSTLCCHLQPFIYFISHNHLNHVYISCLFSIQGKKFFSWQLSDCMQEGDAAPSVLYYPDWAGLNKGCINDGAFCSRAKECTQFPICVPRT
jgi:hypothetical protein